MSDRVLPPASIDPLDVCDPVRYAAHGYPEDLWTRLRAETPIAWFEPEGYEPFWAVTKHADILDVASQPVRFSNEHGLMIGPKGAPGQPIEMVVTLDPPRHGPLRRVAMRHFTPRAIKTHDVEIEALALEVLDRIKDAAAGGEEFDFVQHVAAPLPIAVIAWFLGVPPEDRDLLFHWTNEIIGKDDPEFRRPGETAGQTLKRARIEMHTYIAELVERHRRAPGDDIVSALIAAEIDGQPLSELQLLSYCELMIEAGNETTRNAISGGLLALDENRDQWERLQREPDLLPRAVEEMLRYVTPIIHFTRTAMEDADVHGVRIHEGDKLALFFASANRDDDVFDDPFAFRIDRDPNPHLAFGIGEHFCMGAHLARLEMETVFRHLLARLDSFEVTGPVVRLNSAVNGGIKHLPVRCRLS
jgi:cytochrome P450